MFQQNLWWQKIISEFIYGLLYDIKCTHGYMHIKGDKDEKRRGKDRKWVRQRESIIFCMCCHTHKNFLVDHLCLDGVLIIICCSTANRNIHKNTKLSSSFSLFSLLLRLFVIQRTKPSVCACVWLLKTLCTIILNCRSYTIRKNAIVLEIEYLIDVCVG